MSALVRVVDIYENKDEEVQELLMQGELIQSNDAYLPWDVAESYREGDEPGYGYLTIEQVNKVNDWLRKCGASNGEDVLISIYW